MTEINKQETLELLQNVIRIPSINPPADDPTCANYMCDWLNKNGIPAEIVYGEHVANVVAVLEGDAGGKTMLWNGHLDVVPVGEDWTVDPFGGVYKEEDGCVYGRGTGDMKSGLVSMMLAAKALKESGAKFKGKIILTCVGDEETGSMNGTRMLLAKREDVAKADFAVVSEPTDMYVEIGNRGLRWFDIEIKGVAAHAGRPYTGKNTIEHAADIIKALQKVEYKCRSEIFETPHGTLTPTIIKGGYQYNVVPDRCILSVDRRMVPGETEEMVMEEMNNVLKSVAAEGFEATAKIVSRGWDPWEIEPGAEIVQSIVKSYEKVLGKTPGMRGKGGGTDASHIYHAGIPVVILGAAPAFYSHKADERVELQRVVDCAKIYAESALDLLK